MRVILIFFLIVLQCCRLCFKTLAFILSKEHDNKNTGNDIETLLSLIWRKTPHYLIMKPQMGPRPSLLSHSNGVIVITDVRP